MMKSGCGDARLPRQPFCGSKLGDQTGESPCSSQLGVCSREIKTRRPCLKQGGRRELAPIVLGSPLALWHAWAHTHVPINTQTRKEEGRKKRKKKGENEENNLYLIIFLTYFLKNYYYFWKLSLQIIINTAVGRFKNQISCASSIMSYCLISSCVTSLKKL